MVSALAPLLSAAKQPAPFTILVADADRTNRMVLCAMLQQDGHTVFVAEDGHEAVAIFEERQQVYTYYGRWAGRTDLSR